jgi:hypothetical protein
MEILILISVFAVLGFLYAWIASAVAKESVRGTTGVLILLLTGAITASLLYVLRDEEAVMQIAIVTAAQVATLTVMTRLVTGLGTGKSALLGVVFTGVLFGAGLALSAS